MADGDTVRVSCSVRNVKAGRLIPLVKLENTGNGDIVELNTSVNAASNVIGITQLTASPLVFGPLVCTVYFNVPNDVREDFARNAVAIYTSKPAVPVQCML